PDVLAACAATDVLGASFYLMEPVEGFLAPQGLPALHAGDAAIRRRMGEALVDAIAALGELDPVAVGLAGFGRPEGFLERQRGGSPALAASRAPATPGGAEVGDCPARHRPAAEAPGILHGDYHLANVLFSPDGGELAAILDWELSTVGDPLLDLGQLLPTW